MTFLYEVQHVIGHPSWVLAGKDVDKRTQIERHVVLSMQEGQAS